MTEPRPGNVFAGYLIERALGGGGMGTVYLARHPRLPRHDAIKVLSAEHSADPGYRARFIREAELTARLNHPNIVAVHDRGVEGERLWIAMQYIAGTDAAALVRADIAADPVRAVQIVVQAARGLDEAHRAGMVHRDIKPANLLVDAAPGRADRVLVTDFGIGRSASESTALTEEGAVLATLAYAAPEQLRGLRVDHRADIYALGCTLYELLTGVKPFPRPTPAAVIHAHLADPPPRPSAVNPALPRALDSVVAHALAKDPGLRFGTCGALAAAAEAALSGIQPAAPQPGPRADDVPAPSGTTRISGAGADPWAGTALAPTGPWQHTAEGGSGARADPWAVAPPHEPPRRRTRRAALAAGALLVAVVSAVVIVVVSTRDTASTGVAAPSPTTVAATSSSAPPVAGWGSHTYVANAFPGLLPGSPAESGYGGIRCFAVDGDNRPVDLSLPATGANKFSCNGDKNPLHLLMVQCNADRSEMNDPVLTDDVTVTGRERWERVSGTGEIVYGDVTAPDGTPSGGFVAIFDDEFRAHCKLRGYGGSSGRDLVDRWWNPAPI
ncbi:serine/threonine-protein kinase [Nocardia carnea]|uniref:serine/threonine-protein kinase n=1 Tax=Nocardia carnea TaxID=37328 RepID=UPI0024572B94|nr:serine/threonine-protein kinase [Nocardia carnea]